MGLHKFPARNQQIENRVHGKEHNGGGDDDENLNTMAGLLTVSAVEHVSRFLSESDTYIRVFSSVLKRLFPPRLLYLQTHNSRVSVNDRDCSYASEAVVGKLLPIWRKWYLLICSWQI